MITTALEFRQIIYFVHFNTFNSRLVCAYPFTAECELLYMYHVLYQSVIVHFVFMGLV
jgi:hypothetical protein